MSNPRNRNRRGAGRQVVPKEPHSSIFGKLLVMLAVVAAIVLGVAIFFRVNQVQVQGNRIYSEQQVTQIAGVEIGDNLLMVNKPAVVGNIYANLPYVQTVSVGRVLPDTVVIRIQESEIAGLVKSDTGSSWYINTHGRVLGSSVEGFDGQVVELTGFTVTAPAAGKDAVASLGMEDSLAASLHTLSQMEGTGLIGMVTSIDTEKSFDIRVLCSDRYEVQLGSDDQMEYKIWCLQAVVEELDEYQRGMIDLTMDAGQSVRFIPWE